MNTVQEFYQDGVLGEHNEGSWAGWRVNCVNTLREV